MPDAEELLVHVLETRKKVPGGEHPHMLITNIVRTVLCLHGNISTRRPNPWHWYNGMFQLRVSVLVWV